MDERKMHGRDGILAHSYLLGPKGNSHGCVAFRNYPEFLDAFLKGEIARIVVVARLDAPPGPMLAGGQLPDSVRDMLRASDRTRQLAAAAGSQWRSPASQRGPVLQRQGARLTCEQLTTLDPDLPPACV